VIFKNLLRNSNHVGGLCLKNNGQPVRRNAEGKDDCIVETFNARGMYIAAKFVIFV